MFEMDTCMCVSVPASVKFSVSLGILESTTSLSHVVQGHVQTCIQTKHTHTHTHTHTGGLECWDKLMSKNNWRSSTDRC